MADRLKDQVALITGASAGMLDPDDVATVVLLACTQSPNARIIEVRMRTMAEPLA